MSANTQHTSGPALALTAGLITAQITATVHVFRSNQHIYRQTSALAETGYLSVPNPLTVPQLLQPDSALAGGLFFTLSAGAALSLLSLAAAWLWVHAFARSRRVGFGFGLLLAAGLLLVNRDGFNPAASAYLMLVPTIVFWRYARRSRSAVRSPIAAPLIGLGLLAAGWGVAAGPNLFLDVRDTLLLSNPVGIAVNDFYYRNTLFAAEAFKSPGQRLQKACALSGETDTAEGMLLERSLRNQDWLAVTDDQAVVSTVRLQNRNVFLYHRKQLVLERPLAEMLSRPGDVLAEFSRAVDRWAVFRSLCYFGILLAFPTLLYTGLYLALQTAAKPWCRKPVAAWLSAGICVAAGLACLVPALMLTKMPADIRTISRALNSDSGLQRDAALKSVVREKLEITDFPAYRHTWQSSRLSERYWAARALGVSRSPATVDELMRLLDDPHPNVVCQALAAIGRRKVAAAAPRIRTLLATSNHWYVQRYGYIALRSLGWTQPALTTAP